MPVYVDAIFSPDPPRLGALNTDPLLRWIILESNSQLDFDTCLGLSRILRSLLAQDLSVLLQLFNGWTQFVEQFQQGAWLPTLRLDTATELTLRAILENLTSESQTQRQALTTVLLHFREQVETRLDYTLLYQHQMGSHHYHHPTLIQECQAFQTRLQELRAAAMRAGTEFQPSYAELHLYREEHQRIEWQRPRLMRWLHHVAPQSLNTARQKVLHKRQRQIARAVQSSDQNLSPNHLLSAYNDAIQWTREPLNNISQQLLAWIMAAEKNLAATDPKKKTAAHLAFDKAASSDRPCIDVSFGGSAFLFKSEGKLSHEEINLYFQLSTGGAVYSCLTTTGNFIAFSAANLDIAALNHFLLLRRLQERGWYHNAEHAAQENASLSALERAALKPTTSDLNRLKTDWFQDQAYLILKTLPKNTLTPTNIDVLNNVANEQLQDSITLRQELVRLGLLPALSAAQRSITTQLLLAEKTFLANLPLQPDNLLAQKMAGNLAFDSDPLTLRAFIDVFTLSTSDASNHGYCVKPNGTITLAEINDHFCKTLSKHVYSRTSMTAWRNNRSGIPFSPQTRHSPLTASDITAQQLNLDKLNQLLQLRRLQEQQLTGVQALAMLANLPPFMSRILQNETADSAVQLKAGWFRNHAYVVLQTLPATAFRSDDITSLNAIPEEVLQNPAALQQELVRLTLLPATTAPTSAAPTTRQTASQLIRRIVSAEQPQQQPAPPALSAAQRSVIAQLLLSEKTYLDNLSLQQDSLFAQKAAGRLAFDTDPLSSRAFIDVCAPSTTGEDSDHGYCVKTQGLIDLTEINRYFCITANKHIYSFSTMQDYIDIHSGRLSPHTREPLTTAPAFTPQQIDLTKLNQLLQLRRLQEQQLTEAQALTMIATLSPFMQRVLQTDAAEAVVQLKAGWFQDPAYAVLQTLPPNAFTVANIARLNTLSEEVLQDPAALQNAVARLVPAPTVAPNLAATPTRPPEQPTQRPAITASQSANAPRLGANAVTTVLPQATSTTTVSTASLKTGWHSGEAARYRGQLPAGFFTAAGIRFLNAIPDTVLTHTTAGVFLTNLMQQVDLQNLREYWLQEPYISTLCTLIRESGNQPLYDAVRDSNITDQDGPLITHFLARRLRLPDAQRPSLTVKWLKDKIALQHLLERAHTELFNSPPTTSLSFPLMTMSTSNNYVQHLGEFSNMCVQRHLHATNKAAVYSNSVSSVSRIFQHERWGKNRATIDAEHRRYTDEAERLAVFIAAIQQEKNEYSLMFT